MLVYLLKHIILILGEVMQSLKKCLLVLVSTMVCFNALINDGECLRNKRNLQNQIVSTEKQKLSRQNISNKKEKQQQQVVNNLPTLADDLNSKYVESDIQDNYNNVMDKQTETPVQQFNNKYNKVDASTQYEDPTYQETIETMGGSGNQQGAVPPPLLAPSVVPNIKAEKSSDGKVKEMSLEEELANARSRLKPIGSNNNGNLSNDKIEDNKNFLQNVLSEAIKLRYKNLHMHDDDQDDEGDDDW